MDLLRRGAQHAHQVTRLVLGVARQPPRGEALHHELTRVRLRHLEHVEVGVELRAHGAERGDRLVQEHESRRQVEVHLVDQLEPLPDELDLVDLGQGDAVVARVELVQVADELGLTRLVVANAEIAQPLGQGLDVLGGGVDEERRQLRHVVVCEPPGLAEVDETDPLGMAEHEDVGRMGIAVEDPVTEDHRHPGLGHHVRQPSPLVVRELLGVKIGDLCPLQELEREHPRPGVAPVDARHAHIWVACEVSVEGAGIASLLAIVELLAHRAGELVHKALRVDEVECSHAILGDLRRLVEQRQVGLDLPRRRRSLHLHRDAPAVGKHGRMHLTDRRGGDRLFAELEEQALDWLTELLAYDLLDVGERKRADLVLELSQLDDDVRRDDVGPRGEQLPELHERRAELVEHLAQVLASL